MAKREIPADERYVHFITFSVYRRRRLLNLDVPKKIVLGNLNIQLHQFKARCAGFVIMPNHVHALIWMPKASDAEVFIGNWKRLSSFQCREWYQEHAPNYFQEFGQGEHFWNARYYDFPVTTERKLRQKLDYIHWNPVKAELVKRTIDYRWSSARWYAQRRSVGVPITWIECQ